ncbi:MAG: PD-(D/E)XK nuclease-like domain-containing protein [Devosia sp.]
MTTSSFADGVYFDLDVDRYHADPALGSTDIKSLALAPEEWQWARLHGERVESKALIWGDALHTALLYGRAAFDEKYSVEPDRKAYPNALVTKKDLTDHLKKLAPNRSVPASLTKAELVELIREIDTDVELWDEITKAHVDAINNPDPKKRKAKLTAEDQRQIDFAENALLKHPDVAPAFSAGVSEMSIFVTDAETGVRRKGRFDRAKIGATADLKSYRPWSSVDPDVGARQSIAKYRYDVQAAAYTELRMLARDLISQGKVYGTCPLGAEWLDVFAISLSPLEVLRMRAKGEEPPLDVPQWSWVWIFYKAMGAPLCFGKICEADVLEHAMWTVRQGIDNYVAKMNEFGPDRDWTPTVPLTSVTLQDLPQWMGY